MSVMESNGLIQSKLEPQISPSPGDGSSKDAHQVRVFKCLERMQKMLVDHTKFSTRDIESCIKLKKLLQDNPELSESQISRLECIIGKKVKVELDEIDLKIVEEKCEYFHFYLCSYMTTTKTFCYPHTYNLVSQARLNVPDV